MSDTKHYKEMYDYLSAPALPENAESAVVFGRNDPLVAHKAGELVTANLAEVIAITGGVGKDTGDLIEQGYDSEASYLDGVLKKDAREKGYKLPPILLDKEAKNGGDNARNSYKLLSENGYRTDKMTAVAHGTSARRLGETLKFETGKITGQEPTIYRAPTSYDFNPQNPEDQAEARAEVLRLHNWPKQGMLGEQPDLPQNLVDFAIDRTPPKQ